MSLDTRIHFTSNVLQNQAVLRRATVYGDSAGRYRRLPAVEIACHTGAVSRLALDELGRALRRLGVSARDLGYDPKRYKA